MGEEIHKIETAAKKTWSIVMSWIGGITALLTLLGSLGGAVAWLISHQQHHAKYKAQLALAQALTDQKQYPEALKTYGDILTERPADSAVLSGQLDTAMMWVEKFSSYGSEGDGKDEARSALDAILPILTAALSRETHTRLADVKAHLGWAHFLNAKIAQRESSSTAVSDWQDSLRTDPGNVYAHAMFGNWLLQSGGNFDEAIDELRKAVATGRARPFVRELQLGGLLDLERSGARAETIRVANSIRIAGEQIDPGLAHQIVGWCFDPGVTTHEELVEALGAVPSDEAWQTYSWLLEGSTSEPQDGQELKGQYIHASLLEISGRRDAALIAYREIQSELRDRPGSLQDQVGEAIRRLTRR